MSKAVEIFFDGGCRNGNPGDAGYGFYTHHEDNVTYGWGSIGTKHSNNQAEIAAATTALKELHNFAPGVTEVSLVGDSKYVLEYCLERFPTIDTFNTFIASKPDLKNATEIRELVKTKDKLQDQGIVFKYKHVFAHTGIYANEMADMLATRGVADAMRYGEPTNHLTITPEKEAKKPKEHRDKFGIPTLFCDQFLFDWSRTGPSAKVEERNVIYLGSAELNSQKPKGLETDKAVRYMYYEGEPTKLRGLGGINPEDRYNVVFLKGQCELFEQIRQRQSTIIDDLYETQQFVLYKTDAIFSPHVLKLAKDDQLHYLMPDRASRGSLFSLTSPRLNCSYIMNPPHLAFKMDDLFEANAYRLFHIVSGRPEASKITLTDISSEVYDSTLNGKGVAKLTVKPEWNSKTIKPKAKHPVTGELVSVLTKVGIDSPSRNAFNKWVKDSPKVYIATWPHDEDSFLFAYVVMTDDGELFWNCPYGSKVLERKVRQKKEIRTKYHDL